MTKMRRSVGLLGVMLFAFGCPDSVLPTRIVTDDGLGEHGKTMRDMKDRGPFLVFDGPEKLLLNFFLHHPPADPAKDLALCYRPVVPAPDPSTAKTDAIATERPDDSCMRETHGWIRVPLVESEGALQDPAQAPGFAASRFWIFHYGSTQEDENILNQRLDNYVVGKYRAIIPGLTPATRYEYRVVHNGTLMANRVQFETPPPAGPESKDTAFDFAAIADLRSYDGPKLQYTVYGQLAKAIAKQAMRFVILPGDVSNEAGTSSEFMEHYFKVYDAAMRMTPFYPILGNHDLGTTHISKYRTSDAYAFFQMMALPSNPVAESIEHYNPADGRNVTGYRSFYSFDWGSAHFTAIDRTAIDHPIQGYEDFGKGSAQYSWISNDLDRAQSARWRIAFFHNPPGADGNPGTPELMELLKAKNVDLIIAGHIESPSLNFGHPEVPSWVVLPSGGARAAYYANGKPGECILEHKKKFGFATFHVERDVLSGKFVGVEGETVGSWQLTKREGQLTAEPEILSMERQDCP